MWHRSRRAAASSSRSTWGSDHDTDHFQQTVAGSCAGRNRAAAILTLPIPNSPAVIGEILGRSVGAAANGILMATRESADGCSMRPSRAERRFASIRPIHDYVRMMQGPLDRVAAPSAATTGWSRTRPSEVPTTSWRSLPLPAR